MSLICVVELLVGLVAVLVWLSFIVRVSFNRNAGWSSYRQGTALARACAVKGASPHPIGPRLLPPPSSSRSPPPFLRRHPLPTTTTYAFLRSHLFPRVAPRGAFPCLVCFLSLSLSLSRSFSFSVSCLRRALWSTHSLSLDHLLCLVYSSTCARSFRHGRRDRPQVWRRCMR